jgi:hypothetical protein
LYGPVDIFERFEANSNGGLFAQPDEASGVTAYGTPTVYGFNIWAAHLNLGDNNDDNDADTDAWAARLIYNATVGPGKLFAGVGYVSIDDEVVPTTDYTRRSAGLKYTLDAGHQIGATLEMTENHPAGGGTDWDTYGIAARVKLPANFDLGVGYYYQDGDFDNNAIIGNLRYHVNNRIYCYAEYAQYDEDDPDLSYAAIGVRLNFRGKPN